MMTNQQDVHYFYMYT